METNNYQTLLEVTKAISQRYSKNYDKIKMIMPHHLQDGGLIEFVDPDTNDTLAVGRFMFGRDLLIDKSTSKMFINVAVQDLVFTRKSINITIGSTI